MNQLWGAAGRLTFFTSTSRWVSAPIVQKPAAADCGAACSAAIDPRPPLLPLLLARQREHGTGQPLLRPCVIRGRNRGSSIAGEAAGDAQTAVRSELASGAQQRKRALLRWLGINLKLSVMLSRGAKASRATGAPPFARPLAAPPLRVLRPPFRSARWRPQTAARRPKPHPPRNSPAPPPHHVDAS